jgi:hypothetical protein
MIPVRARRLTVVATISVLLAAFGVVRPSAAIAAPARPDLGPLIEDFGGYDGQSRCDPTEKPGVQAFRNLVVAAYPNTGYGSIVRDCAIGGQSEHKEGRAWDWTVSAAISSQKAAADKLIAWLAAEDRYGNDAAMARRLGIMYLIWNRRIWFPGSGWRTYCRDKNGACREPGSGDVRHPHTDHVHFSFTWAGAKKQTTYWHPERSMIATAGGHPSGLGLWVLGRNGGVAGFGAAGFYGSKSDRYLERPAVAMAPTPSGAGYWLTTTAGKVFAFGDARRRGSVDHKAQIAAMDSMPRGMGYWLVSTSGRVFPFGGARWYGGLSSGSVDVAAIAATPTGRGYWLVTNGGRVVPFGDAQRFGDMSDGDVEVASIAPTPTGLGYWLVTAKGRVQGFGDAADLGGFKTAPSSPVVGLAPTATGQGYWLVGAKGRVSGFGDAPDL